jgi:hypothetical protein
MFTVLGDGRSPDDFAMVFAFGGVVAALGIIGGLMITSSPRRSTAAPPQIDPPA